MDPGVRSARADELFAESATLSRYLEVEAALAACQAQLGVIPESAAQSIEALARVENIDRARYRQCVHPYLVLVAPAPRRRTGLVVDDYPTIIFFE